MGLVRREGTLATLTVWHQEAMPVHAVSFAWMTMSVRHQRMTPTRRTASCGTQHRRVAWVSSTQTVGKT